MTGATIYFHNFHTWKANKTIYVHNLHTAFPFCSLLASFLISHLYCIVALRTESVTEGNFYANIIGASSSVTRMWSESVTTLSEQHGVSFYA